MALAALWWPQGNAIPLKFETETVTLRTQGGDKRFQVEIARTPEQQQHGLMFRENLADDAGMLFLFRKPDVISMWMMNTLIPLDMLFINRNGVIIHIAENTTPESSDIISSEKPALAVLEIKGGGAAAHGIAVGDILDHPYFLGIVNE
ncbi:MAG: DUF192 domain-containing protein [Alphaproteobacteria bacterium]